MQLNREALLVVCGEGVFHTAAEIQPMSNQLSYLVLMMGTFHMAKEMLACIGVSVWQWCWHAVHRIGYVS
jgi:hypothetical protein